MMKLPATVKKEIKPAIEESAKATTEMAKRMVPVDTGDLKDSIKYSFGGTTLGTGYASIRNKHNMLGGGTAELKGDPDLTAYITAGDEKAYYARFVEFGTTKTPAQPFFYPVGRAMRRSNRNRISRAVTKAIKNMGK